MNQFLGMKMKGLCVILLFIPLFAVPSICDAANACIAGTPIFNVIAPNPKTPGGTVSYSAKATGSGFATYEIRASDVGILQSGTFSSGQTVSGNYNTPTGAGLITFNIKDSSGNVIPNCFAKADVTSAQDECKENLKNEICYYNGPSDFHVWDLYVLNTPRVPQYWGTPVSYSDCFKCAPPIAHNFQVNSSNLGLVNSGSIFSNQMVVGSYSIPYGTNRESYALTFPGSDWLTGQFHSWATTAPPCNPSFSLWGTLAVGSNIQFNANAAKINGSRPDNYNWKVDEKPYEQGSNKNIVYDSFSAGPHTILLTVDDGLGTSCSRSGKITIPPPPPACTATFTAPASAYYDQNIAFNPTSSSNSGERDIVYKWSINNILSTQTGFSSPIFNRSFGSSYGASVAIKLDVEHSNGSRCSFARTVNLSIVPPPPPPPIAPSCSVFGMSAPSTADFGTNVNFTGNISGTGIVSYIWKDGATLLGTTVGLSSNGGAVSNNHIFAGATNITKTITLIGTLSDGKTCQGNVSVKLTVPPLPPPLPCTVDFDVRNSTKSCLTSSCNYNEPITFAVSAATGPITGYIWTMDKVGGGNESFSGGVKTGSPVSKTFVPADGKSHKIHLAAPDSNGNTCTMDKTINIKPSMPGWNEIAPYLMQLGPIGFLGAVILSRVIFLWL